jgi:hypothetical protein
LSKFIFHRDPAHPISEGEGLRIIRQLVECDLLYSHKTGGYTVDPTTAIALESGTLNHAEALDFWDKEIRQLDYCKEDYVVEALYHHVKSRNTSALNELLDKDLPGWLSRATIGQRDGIAQMLESDNLLRQLYGGDYDRVIEHIRPRAVSKE